jgi:hypothetical protein
MRYLLSLLLLFVLLPAYGLAQCSVCECGPGCGCGPGCVGYGQYQQSQYQQVQWQQPQFTFQFQQPQFQFQQPRIIQFNPQAAFGQPFLTIDTQSPPAFLFVYSGAPTVSDSWSLQQQWNQPRLFPRLRGSYQQTYTAQGFNGYGNGYGYGYGNGGGWSGGYSPSQFGGWGSSRQFACGPGGCH